MQKKTVVILEILILFGAAVFYFIKEVLPDFKNSLGSSEHLVSTKEYKNMIEFNVDNNVNFAFVINNKKEVYHVFFFDKNSVCLYNKNIEGNSLNDAFKSMIQILIENDYLKSLSTITVTKYSNNYYNEIMNSFRKNLSNYKLDITITSLENTITNKAKELGIDEDLGDNRLLRSIDFYSRDLVLLYEDNTTNSIEINDTNARKYTNEVYKKIEKYVSNNNITSIDKNNTELVITLIPADDDGKIYPTNNSWYYVENRKVYAYIELGNNYGYCYNGSIDDNSKGECK